MSYDNKYKIIEKTLSVYKECKIHCFPINVIQILEHYEYELISYQSLKKEHPDLYAASMAFSEDAYYDMAHRRIFYNEEKPIGRIRFSLMHELGHIMLLHDGTSMHQEAEANLFASHMLAPRMAVHYARPDDDEQASRLFGMTLTASRTALVDYTAWHTHIKHYKMNSVDHAMYQHFYDKRLNCFVWRDSHCPHCQKRLVNTLRLYCDRLCFRENKNFLTEFGGSMSIMAMPRYSILEKMSDSQLLMI